MLDDGKRASSAIGVVAGRKAKMEGGSEETDAGSLEGAVFFCVCVLDLNNTFQNVD